jgi:hypothetical protein
MKTLAELINAVRPLSEGDLAGKYRADIQALIAYFDSNLPALDMPGILGVIENECAKFVATNGESPTRLFVGRMDDRILDSWFRFKYGGAWFANEKPYLKRRKILDMDVYVVDEEHFLQVSK